jgi:hypothetical protein
MTEWWQRDEDDIPAPMPRRDVVPDSGFSDLRENEVHPEAARFVPEFRVRRRKVAIILTLIAVVMAAGWVAALVKQYGADDPETHASGAWTFLYFGFFLGVVVFILWRTWHWANEKDPRDSQPLRP